MHDHPAIAFRIATADVKSMRLSSKAPHEILMLNTDGSCSCGIGGGGHRCRRHKNKQSGMGRAGGLRQTEVRPTGIDPGEHDGPLLQTQRRSPIPTLDHHG